MCRREERHALEQRGWEARCRIPALTSTLEGICNVSLKLHYQTMLRSFFMRKTICSAPSQLVSPYQADSLQTHQPKTTCALHRTRHKQVSSQPPPTACQGLGTDTQHLHHLLMILRTDNHRLPFSCYFEPELKDTSRLAYFTWGYSRYI